MHRNYLQNKVVSIPLSRLPGFPVSTDILVDYVDPRIANIILNASRKTLEKAGTALEEQVAALTEFTYEVRDKLPFLQAPNFEKFTKLSSQQQSQAVTRYATSFSPLRNLSDLTATNDIDCIGQCLAIGYVLNDSTWKLVQSQINYDQITKKKRHVALTKLLDGMYLVLDPTGCPSKEEIMGDLFFFQPPELVNSSYTPLKLQTKKAYAASKTKTRF